MARTAQESPSTRYRKRIQSDECQVTPWLIHKKGPANWIQESVEIQRWLATVHLDWTEVHHICGRSKHKAENDWFCNLILVDKAVHDWGHKNGPKFELACYRAKLEMRRQYEIRFGMPPELGTDQHELHWYPKAMGRVLGHFDGVFGRISYLMEKLPSGSFFGWYGVELLSELKA